MGIRGERVLPPVEVRGAAARALRAPPRVRAAGEPPGRGRLFREGRPERPFRLALEGAVGDPVSGAPGPRRLRLARRARQLHHRPRVRLGRRRELSPVLGPPGCRARPLHRQGHPALPRRVLAGVSPLGRPAAADDRVGARLVAARREEGVEVRRQRRAARPARRGLRRGRPALLPDARDGVRPGRELLGRGLPGPLQRGPRQRPRQHRVARRGAVPAVLRRHAERGVRRWRGAGRFPRGRRRVARRDARVPVQPRPRGGLEAAHRRERPRGVPRALEDPEGGGRRLRQPPRRPVRRGRGRAPRGRDAVSVRPRHEPKDLRDLRPARDRPDFAGSCVGQAAPVETDAGGTRALSARRRRRLLQGKGCCHERARQPRRSRRSLPPPRPPPRPTNASRSRTSRRSACARRRSSPPSACRSRTS